MDVIIEYNESAFRHNISREDIRHALKTKVYAAAMDGFPEKYAVIGFDRAGNPLEIMYNISKRQYHQHIPRDETS